MLNLCWIIKLKIIRKLLVGDIDISYISQYFHGNDKNVDMTTVQLNSIFLSNQHSVFKGKHNQTNMS